jgi:hypothetical protein
MTRQYNQQRSDYNMARRLLRRQARRGDTDAATKLVDLGRNAAKEGVSFGMQNPDQRGAEIARRVADQKQATMDANQAAAKVREESGLVPKTPRLDAAAGGEKPTVGEPPSMLKRPSDYGNMGIGTKALPQTELGSRSEQAMREMGGNTAGFRQGLDRAIGMAKTPEELAELGDIASQSGISEDQFKRRTEWWNKKRR